MLDDPAVMQEHNIAGKPASLADVVGDDDDLDATALSVDQQLLDGQRRRGIEARGRLVEQQDVGLEAERPRQTKPLLLAARQHAAGVDALPSSPASLSASLDADGALAAGDAAQAQRMPDIGGGRAAEQHRFLKHHGLPAGELAVQALAAPQNLARGRGDQAVHEPEQHALAGAVRAHDDGDARLFDGEIEAVDDALAIRLVGQPAKLDRQERACPVTEAKGRSAWCGQA